MQLGEFLRTVASTYDRSAGMDAPAQVLLRDTAAALSDYRRAGQLATRSGSVSRRRCQSARLAEDLRHEVASPWGHLVVSVSPGGRRLTIVSRSLLL